MSNVFDYLNWRGDLSFETVGLSEVDNIIFSRLSCIHFEQYMDEFSQLSIKELWQELSKNAVVTQMLSNSHPTNIDTTSSPETTEITTVSKTTNSSEIITSPESEESETLSEIKTSSDDIDLLYFAANSERFGEVTVCRYVHEFDVELEKQFASITFLLPNNTAFVAFRATDGSLIGWKEDFNLCLDAPIPSQIRAEKYLSEMMMLYDRRFYVGGHSKGGNLAVYAASNLPTFLQQRLIAVYNNDGPGSSKVLFHSQKYKNIEDRIITLVPQASIVGLMLWHQEDLQIVKSSASGISQHDPYSWQIYRDSFVQVPTIEKHSLHIEKSIKNWLEHLDLTKRKEFITAMFDVLAATGIKYFDSEFWKNLLRNPKAVTSAAKDLDPETRQNILSVFAALASTLFKSPK